MASAPTTEQGTVTTGWTGLPGWTTFVDEVEHVPELQWPQSVDTYHRMRNDSQLEALHAAVTLPVRQRRWYIDPNGADNAHVEHVARDLNLPVKGKEDQPRGRMKRRFSFAEFQRLALLALVYGHQFFEQVGEIGDDQRWHLRKMGVRMPHTITDIGVAPDGGLMYIKQQGTSGITLQAPTLSVDRLIAFVWEREGGNWTGRSMFRACYRNWLIKDRLYRVDAINHERAGGIPTIEAPPGAGQAQIAALDRMAQRYKTGEHSGGAVPAGAKLRIDGAKTPDVIASIQEHDQAMARRFLAMFAQLGQTETGSRALGESFIDFFLMSLNAVCDWFRDTVNEHHIEDTVDWNWGEEVENVPRLEYVSNDDPAEAFAPLVSLIDAGLIQVDDELENLARTALELPERQTPRARPPVPPSSLPGGDDDDEDAPDTSPDDDDAPNDKAVTASERRERPVRAAGDQVSPFALPSRPLRRNPYQHEVAAAVDFGTMDASFQSEHDALHASILTAQRAQAEQLRDAIVDANGDLAKIAKIGADPMHAGTISARMLAMAEQGVSQVAQEASRQGKQIKSPDLEKAAKNIAKRAEAVDVVLAESLSDAAKRKALALSGSALSPTEVADETLAHLLGLKGQYLKDQIGGALMAGLNTGRRLTMAQNNPRQVYASELLDSATCSACVERDGTEYPDVEAAELDYPTGGYKDCEGGPRCRGTVVAVWDEADNG